MRVDGKFASVIGAIYDDLSLHVMPNRTTEKVK